MQDLSGLADVAAVGFNDRLMAETDTNDRQLATHAG